MRMIIRIPRRERERERERERDEKRKLTRKKRQGKGGMEAGRQTRRQGGNATYIRTTRTQKLLTRRRYVARQTAGQRARPPNDGSRSSTLHHFEIR